MARIPIKYNLRYLAVRWTSTLTTALTFGLVVGVFVMVMSMVNGIEKALTTSGDPLNVLVMRKGVQAEGQSVVNIPQYETIRNFAGIARDARGTSLVGPEIVVLVNKPRVKTGALSNIQVRGVGAISYEVRPLVKIVEGRRPRTGLREIIVAKSLAGRFQGLAIGEHVRLGKGDWLVVGHFEAGRSAFNSEIWADYRELMQEFDRGEYNTVVARATGPAAVAQIKYQAENDPRIRLRGLTEEEYYNQQTASAGPIKALGLFLAVIMSIGACFAGMNTMYASVSSRVREIGTLRILGFTPQAILASFLIESIALSIIGGAIGCAAGGLIVNMLGRLPTGTMNIETFSEVVFYFTVTPTLLLRGMAFALIMGVVGGVLPAINASKQPILEALRQT
ncbi:ABC transporter permease [bacterium]|nr:ABC transporter permease [bacterium]